MFFPFLSIVLQFGSHIATNDIVRLESVQGGFTKSVTGYKNLSYADRLARAGLCSLELRCLRTDLCLCFEILHKNSSQIHINSDFIMDNVNAIRGQCWKIKDNRPRLAIYAVRFCLPNSACFERFK